MPFGMAFPTKLRFATPSTHALVKAAHTPTPATMSRTARRPSSAQLGRTPYQPTRASTMTPAKIGPKSRTWVSTARLTTKRTRICRLLAGGGPFASATPEVHAQRALAISMPLGLTVAM